MDVLQAEAIADGFADGYTSPGGADFDSWINENLTDPSSVSDTVDLGDDESLKFLHLSFPKQSITTLKFVLNKSNQDVLKAVDDLLNRQLLTEEREFGILEDADAGGAVDDFFTVGDTFFSAKRKRKKRQRNTEVFSSELEPAATRPVSRWDQMSSEVDWIVRVLSVSKATAQSVYHAHNSSLPAALNTLLETVKWEDGSAHPDHQDNHARLFKSFPGLGSIKINYILDATKNQLTLANEVAHVLSAWRPTIGSVTSSLQHTNISAPSKSQRDSPVVGEGMTADECRAAAAEFASKRDAAFRQAATAYQRSKSDGLMGGTAMHYSQLGRDFDAKMRSYNIRAAQLSSTQRSGSSDDLDLHGLSVHEGLLVVSEGVTTWYAKTRMLETGELVKPLRIVTGLGRHSVGGEARLLPAVKKYLDREGWHYETSGGALLVTGLLKKQK